LTKYKNDCKLYTMKMKYNQLVLVEFNNCAPFVYRVVSDKKITIDKVAKHFTDTEGWNEDRDNIIFLDDITDMPI